MVTFPSVHHQPPPHSDLTTFIVFKSLLHETRIAQAAHKGSGAWQEAEFCLPPLGKTNVVGI